MCILISVAKTHIGKVRTNNEDCYLLKPPNLYVIADGMGGHSAGEVASKCAIEYINDNLALTDLKPESILDYLQAFTRRVNSQVYLLAQRDKQLSKMGTTLIIVYIKEGCLYYAHVGDSRLYICRQGILRQITTDHSLVVEMLKKGLITDAEAEHHPNKNVIMRAIGAQDDVEVDTGYIKIEKDDIILLCTDGLTNMLSDTNLQAVLSTSKDMELMAEELIAAANNAGGLDNVTLVLCKNTPNA